LDVLHLRCNGGALKHHVFEEVREAAAALRFEAETDFIVDTDGDNRRSRIGRDNDLKAVRQFGVFNGNVQLDHALPPEALACDLRVAEIFSSSASMAEGSASRTRAMSRPSAS